MRKSKFYLAIAVFAFCLVSCASTKVSTEKVFESDKALVSQSLSIFDYKIGKQLKKETLSEKSAQVSVEYSDSSVPANVYKLSLEKGGVYDFTLKSIPAGIMGFNDEKRTVMIPEVLLYDENFNLVPNEDLKGRAVLPSTFEPFLFKVTTNWNIAETGVYYLVVKADMSSEQGLTLEVFYYKDKVRFKMASILKKFRRVPYGKYKLLIEKK